MCLKFCKPAFVASALLLFVITCEAQTSNPQTTIYTDYDISTWTGHTARQGCVFRFAILYFFFNSITNFESLGLGLVLIIF